MVYYKRTFVHTYLRSFFRSFVLAFVRLCVGLGYVRDCAHAHMFVRLRVSGWSDLFITIR